MTASYQPLARKYRPGTFSELVGQDSTAAALANAIRMGREPHAVIFSGVRGIGKTTSARLYAKALNCDRGSSAEPCNQCESCMAISLGNHEDVVEIDGASNTSVDNVRTLRETISYVPQRSRFKVYIIDEVHMLSQSAFNALLKTLEEPPAHVIFIFATTELHKIPQTILSRCQVFFLQKLSLGAIRDQLAKILKNERIPGDEKAVACIAREGHGSMRDALTLLDHVIAVGNGHVTLAALQKIVSHVSSTPFLTLLNALVDRNANQVIQGLDAFEQGGIEMGVVAEKTAAMARHAAVARDVGIEHIDFRGLGLDEEESKAILEIGRRSQPMDLNRIFRSLVKCSVELDGSALDRYILENYCLEWCLDPGLLFGAGPTNTDMTPTASQPSTARDIAIPHSTASKPVIAKSLNSLLGELREPETLAANTHEKPQSLVEGPPTLKTSFPATWRELVDIWKTQKPLQARKLEEAHPLKYSAESIELAIAEGSYASSSLLRPDELKKLKEAFLELFGFKGTLTVSPKPAGATSSPQDEQRCQRPSLRFASVKPLNGEQKVMKRPEIILSPVTQSSCLVLQLVK